MGERAFENFCSTSANRVRRGKIRFCATDYVDRKFYITKMLTLNANDFHDATASNCCEICFFGV